MEIKHGLHKFVDLYFTPRNFEENLYRKAGVELVKNFISKNPLRRKIQESAQCTTNYFLIRPTVDELRVFEKYGRFNEVTHLISATAFGCLAITNIQTDNLLGVGIGSLLTLANLELVMLQRYNRARIFRILSRIN